jgi:hypothetical protein
VGEITELTFDKNSLNPETIQNLNLADEVNFFSMIKNYNNEIVKNASTKYSFNFFFEKPMSLDENFEKFKTTETVTLSKNELVDKKRKSDLLMFDKQSSQGKNLFKDKLKKIVAKIN